VANYPPPTDWPLGRRLRSVALRYGFGLAADRRPPAARRSTRGEFCGRHGRVEGEPKGPTARSAELARLEAILFIAREPLSSRKLAQLADLADGTESRTLVRALNRLYDRENRAFRAVEVAGGFQLRTRPKFVPWLRRLCSSPVEVRLSGPAMETLAVVAYRQPVLRVAIEAIRGVQCGEILRQLMERDLLRIVGRSEELGRPFLYGTTKRFLQVFGLRSLEELPRMNWFQPDPSDAGLPEATIEDEPCQESQSDRTDRR